MLAQGAVTRAARLFNKNIALRKVGRLCMQRDACPVPVAETLVQEGQGRVNGGSNYDSLKVAKYLAV